MVASSHELVSRVAFGVELLTPWGANHLVQLVEGTHPQAGLCAHDAQRPLVLLSGGLNRDALSPADFGALSQDSTQRMFGLMETGLLTKQRLLLISGGPAEPNDLPESKVLEQLAILLGVAPERLRTEVHSTNTVENALYSAQLLLPQHRDIALVTSALHMGRARDIFEAQGFNVCSVPVASIYVSTNEFRTLIPQSSALLKSESSIHELVGHLVFLTKQAWVTKADEHQAGH